MPFGPDLSQWFGPRAFFGEEDVETLKSIVRDYHQTMDNLNEAADSVSYLARGIGQGLRGLGISGPWQELGNPLSDMWAAGQIVGIPSGNTPAQNIANTQILLGEQVSPDIVGTDPTDPYSVTPQYVVDATDVTNKIEAMPGEAVHYISDTVSKYFHYALIAGIVVGVVIFLPEIKAVTRTLRRVTE